MNKKTREFNREEAEKQRNWSEKMYNEQNAWNYQMWQEEKEYNTPAAQVERMREAGLNPLFYGLDGNSVGSAADAAQPLGYERASADNQPNPLAGMSQLGLDIANMKKDIELKNAQIDKLGADAEGVKLDNTFKEKTMDARVQGEELANSLTKENIGKVQDERKKIVKEIGKIAEETKNEAFKGLLIQAQTGVEKAKEKEILEMLPYEKLLKEAQTEAQKAAAMASFYNAMTQKGLLDEGYIDKYIAGMEADNRLKNANADSAEAVAAINQFKSAVKAGNIWTIDDNDYWLTKAGKQVLNYFFSDVSILGEALTGGLAGILK